MKLSAVYVRFYKSFNFDYLRKFHDDARPRPWEMMGGMWYPYVRIPIDPLVTTVVGANESGKSHLLTAIKAGISGEGIKREDFCRYSQFSTVEAGKMRWPDFGFEWNDLTEEDRRGVIAACGIQEGTSFDRFFLFRTERQHLTAYLPGGGEYNVSPEAVKGFPRLLPSVFEINAKVALPDSVPIRSLTEVSPDGGVERLESLDRKTRFDLLGGLFNVGPYLASVPTIASGAAQIFSAISPFLTGSDSSVGAARREAQAQIELARSLLLKVAKVDPEALSDLYDALREGKEGHVNGIIQKINDHLAASLNFPHWWVQDRHFRLMVSPREFDLVFTIRDRTETEYSFAERSSGLKYFLSYYVQYRAHEPTGGPEILLMDEPDAYLSSQAQQDLLKIFDAFANPEDGRPPVQVIYVTHSPFLIDKNHAERIRVLEKGTDEEGTRVVKDAAKNHYEPLRSAFGAFVGETTFIGNCNLMVEGIADQVLLAGAANHLRAKEKSKFQTLDLNRVTIVPAGSASHIPYLVYLARGRDIEQPAVIVLLDGDTAGNDAKKKLRKGGPHNKQLLKEEFVLQITDLGMEAGVSTASGRAPVEMEDLIPVSIAAEAARRYAREVCGLDEAVLSNITADAITRDIGTGKSLFKAVEQLFAGLEPEGAHIEKVGFARLALERCGELAAAGGRDEDLVVFESNLRTLFKRLNEIRRKAERELSGERVSQRINRSKKSFLQDHPVTAKREEAFTLLEEMEAALDDTLESDEARLVIHKLRREFELEVDMTRPVDRYEVFKERLEQVRYAGRHATQETPSAATTSGKSDVNANSTLRAEAEPSAKSE